MGIEKSKEDLGERSRYTGGAVTRCLMKWLATVNSCDLTGMHYS